MPCVAANSGRRTGANMAARERTATMIDILFHGVGWTDIALTLNRIAVGMFFMFSGYHKLFNPERHRAFADELKGLAFMPWVSTNGGCRQSSSPPAALSSSGSSHR